MATVTAKINATAEVTEWKARLSEAASAVQSLKDSIASAIESISGPKGFAAAAEDIAKGLGEFGAVAGGVAVAAIGALTGAIVELGERGSRIEDVRTAFMGFAEGINVNGSDALTALHAGSQGLISDFDLMKGAAKAMSAGFQGSVSDFDTLGAAAVVLSRNVGAEGGVAGAYQTLTDALTTGRTRALAQLGVTVDLKGAQADLKDALTASNTELTTAAQLESNRTAIMDALRSAVAQAGDAHLTFAEQIDIAKIGVQNFIDDLSVAIATSPAVNTALAAISTALLGAFGADRAAAIATIIGDVNSFAIFLVQAAQVAVTGAEYIVGAYRGLQIIFDGVTTAVLTLGEGFEKGMLGIEKSASNLPVVGGQFKAIAATQQDLVTYMDGVRQSFKDQTADAIKNGGDQMAAFEGAKASLGHLADQMQAAAAKGVTQTEIYKALTGRTGEVKAAHDDLSKAIEATQKSMDDLTGKIELAWSNGMTTTDMLKLFGQAADTAALKAQAMGITVSASVQEMADEYNQHKLSDLVAKDGDKLRTLYTQIMKQAADSVNAGLKDVSKAWETNEKTITATQDDAQNLIDQRTMSSYDLAKTQLDSWVIDQKSKLDTTASNWQAAYDAIDADAAQKLQDIETKHRDTLEQMAEQAVTYGNIFKSVLETLPGTLEKVFSGSGSFESAMSGLAANLGSAFGSKAFTDVFNKLGGGVSEVFGLGFASELGNLMPGIGSAVGALIGPILNSLFGDAGRQAVNTYVTQTFGSFDALQQKLQSESGALKAVGADSQQLWVALTQGVGRNNPDQAKQAIDNITTALAAADKASGDFNTKLTPLLTQIGALGGTVSSTLVDALTKTGMLTSDNLTLLQSLGSSAGPSLQQLTDLQNKYNLTAAQMGPSFQAEQITANFQSLIDDMDEMTRGGMDLKTAMFTAGTDGAKALSGLGTAIQGDIQSAINAGVQIPDNLKDAAAALITQGDLLDASGKKITDINQLSFGETMQTSLDNLNDTLKTLIDTLTNKFPAAAAAAASTPFNFDATITYHTKGDVGDGSDAQTAATGGYVGKGRVIQFPNYYANGGFVNFVPRGTDTVPAMLTAGEMVMTAAQTGRVASAIGGGANSDALLAEIRALRQDLKATGTDGLQVVAQFGTQTIKALSVTATRRDAQRGGLKPRASAGRTY